jgi:tetratricopeptide (TPR) repeat protein
MVLMANLLRRFPIKVALGALLFYGLTLSRGVTVGSLSLTSKIAGWDWQPMADHPLFWLLTLPLRLLPVGWMPSSLNLFYAVCGAVTLGILVRSLELLPWHRPLSSLEFWPGRLPLLLAVASCGLEFNFWQEAVAATDEMLDMLLLAASVWFLLQYRADKSKRRWLDASVIVWGLGMADNWAMLLALPLFIAGVVWLHGFCFFVRSRIEPSKMGGADWLQWIHFLRVGFLLRLAALGLVGFSVYAALPLANGLLPGSPWNLHQAWSHSLGETKDLLRGIHRQFRIPNPAMSGVVVLFYLVPLMALLVWFGNDAAETKTRRDRMISLIFRGLRAIPLLICIWLAFDPSLGPRRLLARQINVTLPLLSFDYLNALAIGFIAGDLLLMLQPRDRVRPHTHVKRRRTFKGLLVKCLQQAATPVLTALLVVVVLGLGARNLPAITLANSQPLAQFGELELASLPPGGGIVVGDFPEKLEVFQAAQAKHKDKTDWLAVDTKALPAPEYRERLKRLHVGDWLVSTDAHQLSPAEMLQLMDNLAQSNRIFYIHPSFGYFFETFYQQPVGLAYELKYLPAGAINPPPLTAETIAQNERVWDNLTPEIGLLQHVGTPKDSSPVTFIQKHLYLETVDSGQVLLLREWYSMALDDWGVQLQRNGLLPAARRRFIQALELNTNNWVARLNLYCNANLQSGTNMSLAGVGNLENTLVNPQTRMWLMSHLGPMDEPDCCYILGKIYQQAGLQKLALQQFGRAHALVPKSLTPEFALAELYARSRMSDQAMTTINHLRGEINKLPDNTSLHVQFALLEAGVWLSQTNLNCAVNVLQNAVEQHPDAAGTLLGRISQAYFTFGDFTNAGQIVTRLLEREPDNIPALLIQSGVLLQTRRAELAIPVLNHVLSLTNSPQAKLNRADAYVQTTNYAAAKSDYLELERSLPNPYWAQYGLAHLAELQKDTNQAIHYLNLCLTNTRSNTLQWRIIRERLDSLQSTKIGR